MPQGFESTGKADVYDDRIFALSALMSQVRGLRSRASCCIHWFVWLHACRRDAASSEFFACHRALPPPQILIYNLPESIRESDLEKLSFAVELSKAFYLPAEPKATAMGAVNGSNAAASVDGSGDAGVAPIQPGNMVWLIQRDFLQVRKAWVGWGGGGGLPGF